MLALAVRYFMYPLLLYKKKNTTMHGSYTFLMYSKYLLLIFLRIPKSSNVYWEAHKKLKRCTNMDTMDKTRLSKQYKFLNFATNQLYSSPQINWAWSQVSCSISAMQGCMLGILDSAVTSPPCISSQINCSILLVYMYVLWLHCKTEFGRFSYQGPVTPTV